MPQSSLLSEGNCKGWINEASMARRQTGDASEGFDEWKMKVMAVHGKSCGGGNGCLLDGRMLIDLLTSHFSVVVFSYVSRRPG